MSDNPLADLAAAARTRSAPRQAVAAQQQAVQPVDYQTPSLRTVVRPVQYSVVQLVRAGFWLGVGFALAGLCLTVVLWVLTFVGCAALVGGLSMGSKPAPAPAPFYGFPK